MSEKQTIFTAFDLIDMLALVCGDEKIIPKMDVTLHKEAPKITLSFVAKSSENAEEEILLKRIDLTDKYISSIFSVLEVVKQEEESIGVIGKSALTGKTYKITMEEVNGGLKSSLH